MTRPDPLLSVPEAAEYLNVKVRWIRRAIENRWIPFSKVGGQIRFRQSDLDAYVEARVVPASER